MRELYRLRSLQVEVAVIHGLLHIAVITIRIVCLTNVTSCISVKAIVSVAMLVQQAMSVVTEGAIKQGRAAHVIPIPIAAPTNATPIHARRAASTATIVALGTYAVA